MKSLTAMQAVFNRAKIVALVALMFCVGVVLLPLAVLMLLLAYGDRKLHPGGESGSLILGFLVMSAGMVLNFVVLPICLGWCWITGKSMGPSVPSPRQPH